jgi:hypothetical protein
MPPTRADAVATFALFFTARRITFVLLLLLFAVGAKLRYDHADDVTTRSPDEKWYTFYAGRVAENGPAEDPVLVREYIADPARDIYPPPWRIGYLWPLAEIMKSADAREISLGAQFSFALSLATLALVGVLCARYLPPSAALCAMLCLAVSVPDMAIARRTWPDALMSGLGLAMAWSAWEITRFPKRWWNYGILLLAGGYSCLVKESGVFVLAACAVYVLAFLGRRKAWRAVAGFTLGGLAVASVCLYGSALAAGGLPTLRMAWHMQSLGFQANTYGAAYQTGPWYRLIRGFWILGPANLLLSALAVCLAALPDRWLVRLCPSFGERERSMLRLFSWLSVVLVGMILVLPIAQNFRYLSPMYAPMCLLSGLGLWALLDAATRKLPRGASWAAMAAVGAVLVSVAMADYRSFEKVYVVNEMTDLPIRAVLETGR